MGCDLEFSDLGEKLIFLGQYLGVEFFRRKFEAFMVLFLAFHVDGIGNDRGSWD